MYRKKRENFREKQGNVSGMSRGRSKHKEKRGKNQCFQRLKAKKVLTQRAFLSYNEKLQVIP